MTVISKVVQFYMWTCKLRKIVPRLEGLKIYTLGELRIYRDLSTHLKNCFRNSGIPRLRVIGADLLGLELQQTD